MQIIRDIKSIPVLRPLIALIIGILAESWIKLNIHALMVPVILSWLILSGILIFRISIKPAYSWISGILVFGIFISSGILVISGFHDRIKIIPENADHFWLGTALTSPVIKNKVARYEMKIFQYSCPDEYYKTQVSIPVSASLILPRAGQTIIMKTKPEKIRAPMNPGEFDYAEYLKNANILYRCYVKEKEWSILDIPIKFSLGLFTLKLRDILWNRIESLEPANKNLGVLYAISLGSKDLLTPDIRESYAVTGVMHVLVVSGQHVALIWVVLSYIFMWMKNIPAGKFIQFFLIAGLIWFYSLMTGMTASIVRSAIMFTLVSLGKIIQKESSIYNSLAVSAFSILLFRPQWLTDAGFQLSYIAVLSIVFFQPRIIALMTLRNWVSIKIWEITSVSIAAQLGTLPLTLFYFNRFPPWFIISNLVVIPLVTVIMVVFIVMLFFLMIPIMFSVILKLLLSLIAVMNLLVSQIERLPAPPMDAIYLSDFQMFCFVMSLLGVSFFIRYRINNLLIFGMASLLFLFSAGTWRKFNSSGRAEIILFSVPGKMILGLIGGNKGALLSNARDAGDLESSFNFNCKPYFNKSGIQDPVISCLNDSSGLPIGFHKFPGNMNFFFRYCGKSILILNDPLFYKGIRSSQPLTADIIIINNRIPGLWNGQNPLFITNHLLISTACSKYIKFQSDRKAIILAESISDTRNSGAFRFSLNIND
jgi:competence protein ComEC